MGTSRPVTDEEAIHLLLRGLGKHPYGWYDVLSHWDGATIHVTDTPIGTRYFAFRMEDGNWADPVRLNNHQRCRGLCRLPPVPGAELRSWSPWEHGAWPRAFKEATRTMLCVLHRTPLPNELKLMIIEASAPLIRADRGLYSLLGFNNTMPAAAPDTATLSEKAQKANIKRCFKMSAAKDNRCESNNFVSVRCGPSGENIIRLFSRQSRGTRVTQGASV